MIKKNLWAYRKQNSFIFAEIILITVLSFFFLDHFTVTNYDTYLCRHDGDFEREHLVIGQVGYKCDKVDTLLSLPSQDFVSHVMASLYALRDQVRDMPEVQYAGLIDHTECIDDSYYRVRTYSSEADSTHKCSAYEGNFVLHEQFFETQGLTPVSGSPSAKNLSDECPEDGAVISRSMALALFGTDQVVGRRIVEWDCSDLALQEKGGLEVVNHYTIAGVLKDFRMTPTERYAYSILTPHPSIGDLIPNMLIRLKPEADAETFVNRLNSRLFSSASGTGEPALRNGDRFLTLKTYKEWTKEHSLNSHTFMAGTLIGTLLILFLLNVILGTLGTYWLQILKRTEDFGIMRSFGALRRNIFGMVWKEVALLTLLACIVGQLIWLQFALHIGLSEGYTNSGTGVENNWVNTFWLHFLVICVIQYILLLIIVTLGMIIPSLIAIYKKPVDALHYE